MAGMTPATTVTANRPAVTRGLASQTSRMTLGSAAAVPRTDSLRLRQRLRRSFGPCGSCGSSITGLPVRPLFAWPLSGGLERPRPHIQPIDGAPCPGGIIPTALPYRMPARRSASEWGPAQASSNTAIASISIRKPGSASACTPTSVDAGNVPGPKNAERVSEVGKDLPDLAREIARRDQCALGVDRDLAGDEAHPASAGRDDLRVRRGFEQTRRCEPLQPHETILDLP